MNSFYKLSIKKKIQENARAVSLVFDLPEKLKSTFLFKAGQYLTLKANIGGEEVRRAYSICSSPYEEELRVGIKTIEKGVFSNYAFSQLKTGDVIEVCEPEGTFILEPVKNTNYIGFAAGSGITPILSMIKAVLHREPSSSFTLIYGNKSLDETMFISELEKLKEKHSDRFNLHYLFTRQRVKGALSGRIDASYIEYFIQNRYKKWSFETAFLCGPEEMIRTVSAALKEQNFEDSQILFELFTTSTSEVAPSQIKEGETEVSVLLDGEDLTFTMKKTHDILAAALRNNVDAPYSCQGGICSSCMGKVTRGNAIMSTNSILTDEEVSEGFILTCQAYPTTSKISIDFDNL